MTRLKFLPFFFVFGIDIVSARNRHSMEEPNLHWSSFISTKDESWRRRRNHRPDGAFIVPLSGVD